MKINNRPSHKPGMETPVRASRSAARANNPAGRMAASTPAGTAHSTPMASAQVESSSVAGRRRLMSSSTGL